MTRFAALRAVRELAACSDKEIASLLEYCDEVRLSAGAHVAEKGRQVTNFLVVMAGTLRTGRNLLGPGDSYGWEAMWERSASCTTVTAESDARLLVMSHAQFRVVKGLAGVDDPRETPREVAEVQFVA